MQHSSFGDVGQHVLLDRTVTVTLTVIPPLSLHLSACSCNVPESRYYVMPKVRGVKAAEVQCE